MPTASAQLQHVRQPQEAAQTAPSPRQTESRPGSAPLLSICGSRAEAGHTVYIVRASLPGGAHESERKEATAAQRQGAAERQEERLTVGSVRGHLSPALFEQLALSPLRFNRL